METKGVVACAIPTSDPLGLKAIPSPLPAGNVAGLAYLVPNPFRAADIPNGPTSERYNHSQAIPGNKIQMFFLLDK